MNMIPEELLEQFERGNVLLLIGEGVNQGILPSSQELARELAERSDYPAEGHSLARVASYYEMTRNRRDLIRFLRGKLPVSSEIKQLLTQSEIHQLLAQLEVGVMVTTCVDQLLASALHEAGVKHTTVVDNSQIVYSDEGHLLLVNLRGVLDQPKSLIITEDDQRNLLHQRANISDVLRGELARRTLLLIGFDASNRWFADFYDQVTRTLDRHRRPTYILGSDLDDYSRLWWEKRNAELLDVDIDAFLQQLVQELGARKPATDSEQEPSALPLPERPYKFLDYYEAKDARIFYGREQEIQHLCALIHAHRLVLLHGTSGVGKTSLLLAGAVPRLEQAASPYKAIYVRALEDPAQGIRNTLHRLLPDADLPTDGSLLDFLVAVTNTLPETLLIILDQFEEFFIRLSAEFRAAFIKELGEVYEARDVPVKVIFSLREDWLGSMDEIEQRIPDIFRTRMRVSRLTRSQAQEAITGPVEQLGISYEPALLERLLEDLLGSSQKVMPPQLQLVCNTLYDALAIDEQVIKLASYEGLGGIQGLLRKYLEEELGRLEPAEQVLARAILEELVTSEGTKAVKNSGDLALGLEVKRRTLLPLLEWLVQRRLLRALKSQAGQRAYELAHEYLIKEIRLSAESQARKEAEELIQQEIENWRRFATVLAADKLAIVNQQREVLRLNHDAQALLLQSALQVGQDVEYWHQRVNDVTRRIELLSTATRSKLPLVRQRAVTALGSQDVLPAVEPLLTAALHDSNSVVCDAACESLARLTTQQPVIVERLIGEVAADESENGTGSTRASVLRTLTYLPFSDLPLSLRTQVLMMRILLYLTSLIEASLATPRRRAMVMTTGVLVLLAALAVTFSAYTYSVDTQASQIEGDEPVIVIRQGLPQLSFPGLHDIVVDSGIGVSQIKTEEDKDGVENKWWFSSQTTDGGFHQWGQDVADLLKLEDRAPMLWYLGEEEQAFNAILDAMRSQDRQSQIISVQLLEQVVRVKPERAEAYLEGKEFFDALLSLLEHEQGNVRASAASALGQVAEAYPELVTEALIDALEAASALGQNDENDVDARAAAVSALGQAAKANSRFALKVIDALLLQLSDEQSQVGNSVVFALAEVAKVDCVVAQQIITALLPRLEEQNNDNVRARAAFAVGQVVKANSHLAEQVIDPLLRLLKDEQSQVRNRSASAVGQVVEAYPLLAGQVIDPLLVLLKGDDSQVRRSSVSAVEQVVKANPDLAQQLIERLLPLLEEEDPDIRKNAVSAMGEVGEANPAVAEQVIDKLLPLLKDEESAVNDWVAFAVGEVLATNSTLAQQYFDRLFDYYFNINIHEDNKDPEILTKIIKDNKNILNFGNKNIIIEFYSDFIEYKTISIKYISNLGKSLNLKDKYIEFVIKSFQHLLKDSDTNPDATSILAHLYIHEKENKLVEFISHPNNTLQRPVAARALFLITLQEPSRDANIRQELKNLSESPEPMKRIWANKTLTMLDLATEAHQAAKLDGTEREKATNRLKTFCDWHDEEDDCHTAYYLDEKREINFFGKDFTWAAGEAVYWLEEQTNKQRRSTVGVDLE